VSLNLSGLGPIDECARLALLTCGAYMFSLLKVAGYLRDIYLCRNARGESQISFVEWSEHKRSIFIVPIHIIIEKALFLAHPAK
jgi:hypothetical protein